MDKCCNEAERSTHVRYLVRKSVRSFHPRVATRERDHYGHSRITTHVRFSWVVGGVHREHTYVKTRCLGAFCGPAGFGHDIDEDWDQTRASAINRMRRHCSYGRWRYRPGAHATYQGYPNTGWVARISMKHVPNCAGA